MITRRRKFAYAATAIVLALALGVCVQFGLDIYVHHRTQNEGGVNVWGYRGRAVGRKVPGETWIVVLGGSTAFGYGVPYDEAFPFYLEKRLNASGGKPYRVVNLGAPSQGAFGFSADLTDYAYLRYDVAILYEGYNDLGVRGPPAAVPPRDSPNYSLWRRQSPLFRLAGYFPIMPVVLREKAMILASGGHLDAAYRGRVAFRPGLATRTTATALQRAADIADRLGFQIGPFSGAVPSLTGASLQELETWRHYTSSVLDAVALARQRGVGGGVVTQPYASDSHIEQQRALSAALASSYGGDRAVKYVNLGTTIDLRDPAIAYDGLHPVARGNAIIAEHLVEPVLEVARR
jgi:hypothetical protein